MEKLPHQRVYRFGEADAVITTDWKAVLSHLDQVYFPLIRKVSNPADPMIRIELRKPAPGLPAVLTFGNANYSVFVNYEHVEFRTRRLDVLVESGRIRLIAAGSWEGMDVDLFSLCLKSVLTREFERALPDLNIFHGSAVCHKGGGVVGLLGGSGSGKTTLGLGLVRCGYAFLADDDIFLNSISLLVTPFLRAVHLRKDSLLRLGIDSPGGHVASTSPEIRIYTTVNDLLPRPSWEAIADYSILFFCEVSAPQQNSCELQLESPFPSF